MRSIRQVFTIHGINSSGAWQQDVDLELKPFFDPVALRYPHYRWFGITKLVVEPIAMLAAAAVIASLAVTGILPDWRALLAYAWVAAVALAPIRRHLAFRDVTRQVDDQIRLGRPPHFIGHSLGTFLIARLLKDNRSLCVDRLVLAGCVLDAGFDWSSAKWVGRVGAVRNEVAGKDKVARLAFLLWGLVPGLGHAGYRGFHLSRSEPRVFLARSWRYLLVLSPAVVLLLRIPPWYGLWSIGLFLTVVLLFITLSRRRPADDITHWLNDPWGPCERCVEDCRVLTHNVWHPELGHGDLNNAPGFARVFWLPHLWAIEPFEYRDWLNWCDCAKGFAQTGDESNRVIVEEEIAEREWRWAREIGEDEDPTLRTFIERQLSARGLSPASDPELVAAVVKRTWKNVTEAIEARGNLATRRKAPAAPPAGGADGPEDPIQWLYPPEAVCKAVDAVLWERPRDSNGRSAH